MGIYNYLNPINNGKSFLSNFYLSNVLKFKPYKSRHNVYLENSRYIIKTAENNSELISALAIRYSVFKREILNKSNIIKLDIDKFDKKCDHIIVYSKDCGKIVGTYRINLNPKRLYSAKEFNIKNIIKLNGRIAELGRACILKEHRKGIVLKLLWKGIKSYIEKQNIEYIFGCSSVFINDIYKINEIFKYFEKNNYLYSKFLAKPKHKFRLNNFESIYNNINNNVTPSTIHLIPDLLKYYLRLGAKVCSYPAFDKNFNCVDFLTIIEYTNIKNSKVTFIKKL
ncbi:MAG: GNAT family N-acyltransferase [Deferribacterota bacterium]|nr:GNAT family N-acyltransferase [Deferribacterota bacterium]